MLDEPYGHNLSNFLDYTNELVLISDLKGQILGINHSLEKFLNINEVDFIGNPLTQIIKQLNIKFFKKNTIDQILINLPIINIKCKCIIHNDEKQVLWSCLAMTTSKQIINGLILIGNDVTTLKKLHADIELLDSIIKYAPDWIYWKDKNSVHLGCNDQFAKAAGFPSHSEMLGKTDYDFPWKDRADKYTLDDKEVMRLGIPKLNIEDTVLVQNGCEVTVISNKVPLRSSNGKIIGVLGIATDITNRKKLEEDLRIAKEAAEAANTAKTEFIANMSHDIRTPLTGVIGLSEMLENDLSNPEQKENAHMLHDSGEELLSMLNDILDDVRAEHMNESDVCEEEFDLYQCIEDLMRLELPTTKLKHLGLQANMAADVPQYLISDRKKIHRILLNLLGNAIKFTQSGQITIEVKCLDVKASSVHLQFAVADTGIGISEEVQAKVFDRFFRVTSSYKGLYDGHGLGLHIAQSYVSLLGGHITLTSKEGVGTTFYFDLQCKTGHKKHIKRGANYSFIEKPIPAPEKSRPAPRVELPLPPVSTTSPHLLLVEDNAIALKVLESIASSAGYRFTSASDGEQALQLAQSMHFDLIITDIGLPGISGNELSQRIRDWEKTQKQKLTPILGLTAQANEIDKPVYGMNKVFIKPISLKIIQEMVKQFVTTTVSDPSEDNTNQSKLNVGLPATEDELFQLDNFPLFDPNCALKINDLTLLFALLNDFISDTTQQDIQLMKQAYAKKDWGTIEKIALKVKGSVSYIGAIRMYHACQYLEQYYKEGRRTLLGKLYQQLLDVNSDTMKALKKWLKIYEKK